MRLYTVSCFRIPLPGVAFSHSDNSVVIKILSMDSY
jgi:hypothetical protein